MIFDELSLCKPLLKGLADAGYETATPIQEKAIPKLMKGRDLVGCAQTGTGKTAAFVLPMLHHLVETARAEMGPAKRRQRSGRRVIRCLILAPTRELAGQIGDSVASYGRHTRQRRTVIFGGVRQGPQVRALRDGVDILVATPGRLLDLVGQGFVDLQHVEILVLDEADQMLDMGFIHDLTKIVNLVPNRKQTMLFSATMPKEIRQLADQWLTRPFEVRVTPVASTPELVSQCLYLVERPHKAATLTRILRETKREKTLIFSRTKHGADRIAKSLERNGIRAVSVHGGKSQSRRQAVMREFHSDSPPILVATDLAARGLDFSGISHVINYELPEVPETYVHRIGRTARAGASGQALSLVGSDERVKLRGIERLTGQKIEVKDVPESSTPRGSTQRDTTPRSSGSNSNTSQTKNSFGKKYSKKSSAKKPYAKKSRSDASENTSRPKTSRAKTAKAPAKDSSAADAKSATVSDSTDAKPKNARPKNAKPKYGKPKHGKPKSAQAKGVKSNGVQSQLGNADGVVTLSSNASGSSKPRTPYPKKKKPSGSKASRRRHRKAAAQS